MPADTVCSCDAGSSKCFPGSLGAENITGSKAAGAAAASISSSRLKARRHLNIWLVFTPCSCAILQQSHPSPSSTEWSVASTRPTANGECDVPPLQLRLKGSMATSSAQTCTTRQRGTPHAYRRPTISASAKLGHSCMTTAVMAILSTNGT